MPEKYVRREGLPLLVRHTGRTSLPEVPPFDRTHPEHAGSQAAEDGAEAAGTRSAVVVCLHDAGFQSSVFEALLGELDAAHVDALAFDLPGHGRSGSLDALPSIEAMVEMAEWVARWCGVDEALLVGHGMGALVGLEWARCRPDSIAGLLLCGTGAAFGIDADAVESMRRVTLGKAPRPFDPAQVCKDGGSEMMRRAYMECVKTDPRATLVDLEASRSWTSDFQQALESPEPGRPGAIDCPVRILSGTAETISGERITEQLVSKLPGASSGQVEGAAHFLPLEKPAALASEIQRMLGESPRAS
jgi:pimeloyl-ACP methyl ester carboxylesterase